MASMTIPIFPHISPIWGIPLPIFPHSPFRGMGKWGLILGKCKFTIAQQKEVDS